MGLLPISRTAAVSNNGGVSNISRGVPVKVTKASARDTAFFSENAQNAAQAAQNAETAKESDKETDEKKSFAELIKEQTEKIESLFSKKDYDKANDRQLMNIRMKMRGGLTLSANEERYLEKNDPDGYENYRTTRDACRTFRSQLMCCRTKDEVNGMRLSNALSALSAYKKATKGGGDGSAVAGLNMALEREISSFAQSAKYRSLPTAAERDKYYMELAKARKFEREKNNAKKLNSLKKKKKQVKFPGDGKRTVAQVQNSPLGKKVRNANKSSCCGVCYASTAKSSYRKMDQKG